MKHFLLVLAVSVAGISAQAGRATPEEMRANFDICAEQVPYWLQNFGKYVIAFDQNQAYEVCSRYHFTSRVTRAYCRTNSKNLQAGFYCDSNFGGR